MQCPQAAAMLATVMSPRPGQSMEVCFDKNIQIYSTDNYMLLTSGWLHCITDSNPANVSVLN